MKRRMTLLLCVCLSVLSVGCASLGGGGVSSYSALIAPLSDEASCKEWHVRSNTKLDLVKWPDGTPGFCGKLTLEKYEGKGEQWPAIIMNEKGLRVKDWSFIQTLRVPIYAEEPGYVRLHLTTGGKGNAGRFSYDLKLNKGHNSVVVSRESLHSIPLNHITSLHFFMTRPTSRKVYYIGDVTGEFEDPKSVIATFKRETEAYEAMDCSGLSAEDSARVKASLGKLKNLVASLPEDGSSLDSATIRSGREAMQDLRALRDLSQFMKLNRSATLSAGWTSGAERVYQDRQTFVSRPRSSWTFTLAGNEREGAQFVLYGLSDLKDLRVTAELSAAGMTATVHPIGYVWCEPCPMYHAARTGWMPDPICDYASSLTVQRGQFQPYYVEVSSAKGMKAGTYSGQLKVRASGMSEQSYPFEVRVLGFDLPDGSPYPLAIARGATNLGKAFPKGEQARKDYAELCARMMTDHRLDPDSIYRRTPPTVEEAKRISASPKGMFNIMYVATKCTPEGTYPQKEKEQVLATLAKAIPQYRQAGILKRAYIYGFDEASPATAPGIRDICREIKKRYPEVPIMTTAYDDSYGIATDLDSVIDIWVPLSSKLETSMEAAAAARKRGRQIWWYICIGPRAPYANLLIDENDTIDARLVMGLMAQKCRPEGFLYYCAAMWRRYKGVTYAGLRDKPMRGAPRTDWLGYSWKTSNGDGNWFYPAEQGPVPSLRLKNMNDGLEDYHYWEMLRQAMKQVQDGKAAMPEDWMDEAKEARAGVDRLVRTLTDYTKSFEELETERLKVGALLERFYRKR